jgi:hypothetical protein
MHQVAHRFEKISGGCECDPLRLRAPPPDTPGRGEEWESGKGEGKRDGKREGESCIMSPMGWGGGVDARGSWEWGRELERVNFTQICAFWFILAGEKLSVIAGLNG